MEFIKSKAPTAARLFLGLVFTVFGLNGFFQFAPMPEMSAEAGSFLGALGATGYMFPLIKGTEVAAGVLLLSNRFVPLALALLAPVTVNILLFHTVLAPALAMPLALIAAQLFLAYSYREVFRPMLQAKNAVATGGSPVRRQAGAPLGAH
jgi:hypothetical protein